MRKRLAAFTILEIMVVLTLVGLLAAIVTPHLLNARSRTNQKVCMNNLRQIDQAIQIWAAETKAVPTDVVTHTNLVPYLRTLPTCPAVRGGTFFSDYGMTFVQDSPFCIVNVSFASAPHSLNPITVSPVAAGDARPAASAPQENFPRPRHRN